MKERAKELLHQLAMGRRDCVEELAEMLFPDPAPEPQPVPTGDWPTISEVYADVTVTRQDIPVKTPKVKKPK